MNPLAADWDEEILVGSRPTDVGVASPAAVPLLDLAELPLDPTKTLLGNRFLCIGGGMLFVGPSGIGKSSASVQQDLLWGLGKPAFGIQPARPLRTLCIQAENDDGDLGEMARGVLTGLNIGQVEREVLRDRVLYVSEKARTAGAFLVDVVAPLLKHHRPDILRIDPLLAYIGGDVNDAETTAAFLRNGLNPLLDEFECAVILNHHTPKVTNRDTSNWRGSDWMYAGAGSADLTNWCRAALVIEPTYTPNIFRFIAAKRGGRIGWRDHVGERITSRLFRHGTDGAIYWQDASDEDALLVESSKPTRRGPVKTPDDLLKLLPQAGAVPKNTLICNARTAGISDARARAFIDHLIDSKVLHEWRIRRPRTNPLIKLSLHPQPVDDE